MRSRASKSGQRSQGASWRRMKDEGAGGGGVLYRASTQEMDMASGAREHRMDEGAGGQDRSSGSRKSLRSSGRWHVLVLLSEVQQWFGCNIQRPENMEAGFGEEEH